MITRILLSITAVTCLLLVGVDLAFAVWARSIFMRKTYHAWRYFFLGKAMMAGFIGVVIWEKITEHKGFEWELPLAMLGGLFSVFSLWRFYRVRDHYFIQRNEK